MKPDRLVVSLPNYPFAVGILRWKSGQESRLTIIVKAELDLGKGDPRFVQKASHLQGAEPHPHPTAQPDELWYPSDWVPKKEQADVIVVGHLHSATPESRIDGSVRMGLLVREFSGLSASPATRIPLLSTYLRGRDGMSPARAAAQPPSPLLEKYTEATDMSVHNAASAEWRTSMISADATIELSGLSPEGPVRTIRLPKTSPRLMIDAAYNQTFEFDPPCDTLWIDTDGQRAVMVWRDVIEVDPRHIDRIFVSMESIDSPTAFGELRRLIPRAPLYLAAEEDQPSVDPVDEDEEHIILMARHEALCAEGGVDPTVSIADYASISAELSEAKNASDRGVILTRHQFTEELWMLEDQGWLTRLAAAAEKGDGTLGIDYSEQFLATKARLAGSDEPAKTLSEFAVMQAQIEHECNPGAVMHKHGISPGAWMRLDKYWRAQTKADEVKRAQYEAAFEAERSRLATGQDEDDDTGVDALEETQGT